MTERGRHGTTEPRATGDPAGTGDAADTADTERRGAREAPLEPAAPRPGRPRARKPGGAPPAEPNDEPNDEPRDARRGGRGRRLWRVAALLAIAATLAAGAWVRTQLTAPAPRGEVRVFEVEPGWGAARTARELEASGLVRDAAVFRYWLQWRGLDRSIGAGLYDLAPTMSAFVVARELAAGGRPRTTRVVIPEGFRARDAIERIAAEGLAETAELTALADDAAALDVPWPPGGLGLEGYLFPASYEFRLDVEARDALEAMTSRFEDELTDEVRAALEREGLEVHDWVTLASMVQAEAAGPGEMAIIAGVFRNRLDRGMLLQSDPTVAYGLGKDLPELDVLAGDFDVDHPWNTYTRPGLPVGPIGNPGGDALDAVLEPQRTAPGGADWLYFLHGVDDGEAVFRPNVSLADHNRDVERYLR